jgi:hypothetical protein
MSNIVCNIDKADRTNRMVFGVLLVVGALIGLGKFFMILLGIILIAEGYLGWCGIPIVVAKWKEMQTKKP